MDIGILKISNSFSFQEDDDKIYKFLISNLFKKNISISNIVFCDKDEIKIKNTYNLLLDNSKALVVLVSADVFDFVKNIVCELINSKLVVNDFAKTSINAFFKNKNQPLTKKAMENCCLPEEARCISNTVSEFCGYYYKVNDKDVFVIPHILSESVNMLKGSIFPLLSKNFGKNYFTISIKTFSLSINEIDAFLPLFIKTNKVKHVVFSDGLICEIILKYQTSSDKIIVDEIVGKIYEKFGKYIFTDEDSDLQDIVCDILDVQKKSIAVFEDATFGSLSRMILEAKSFKDFMLEKAEIISTDKMKKYFGDNILEEETFIKQLINNNLYDEGVVVCNLKSRFENNVFYVGIGINGLVDIYKIKLIGEDYEINLKLNQTTLFYLIKKLKQKHF